MSANECGEIKGNGEPCDYEAKYADGKCGIHTTETESRQGGAKFTDERARLVIKAAQNGKSKRGCERAAGVGKDTLRGWLEQDHLFENADGKIARFSGAFAQARAESEHEFIRRGLEDPDVDSSFAKFMLASSFGYKKTEQREVTGEDGGPVSIEFNEEVVETPWSEENQDE